MALGARQAGAARGRAGRRRRRVQRAGVLVLPAVLRHRPTRPWAFTRTPRSYLVQPARGHVPRLDLVAFAIGALAGMLIRRVVPAIVATLAVYAGLAFATAGLLREHYLTPLVTTNNFNLPGTSTAWIISQWSAKDGRFAFTGNPPISLVNKFCSSVPAGPGKAGIRWKQSRSAWLGTATRSGPATSQPAGSGHSSGSRAAGSSRCQRCSSPRPSGWSTAAPPDPPPDGRPVRRRVIPPAVPSPGAGLVARLAPWPPDSIPAAIKPTGLQPGKPQCPPAGCHQTQGLPSDKPVNTNGQTRCT